MPEGLQLLESSDVDEYAGQVTAFLTEQPVARNVLLTVMGQARTGWPDWTRPPYFWWLTESGATVGSASWTPPFPLLISSLPPSAAVPLARSALARAASVDAPLRAVTGPRDTAQVVAAALAEQTGTTVVERMRMVVHDLPAIRDVPRPPGGARRATGGDTALVKQWMRAFNHEAHAGFDAGVDGTVRAWIDAGRVWLWIDDGEPRSTATHQPAVGGVVRVGAVYTPPQQRGRGYARRLVYEVSELALRTPGVRTCTLNTDAANPVSNAIYRQIGYAPVAEHAQFALLG
ncbi:MAG TPA: GNAT family N-acetyltransferase [Candidatus Dormibacteraeota bacterium]